MYVRAKVCILSSISAVEEDDSGGGGEVLRQNQEIVVYTKSAKIN